MPDRMGGSTPSRWKLPGNRAIVTIMNLEDVNTADQAADYLKLTTEKLKALARKGEIGHIRAGRSYLFTRAAIEEWLKRNTRASRLPPEPPRGLTEGAWRNIQRGRRR